MTQQQERLNREWNRWQPENVRGHRSLLSMVIAKFVQNKLAVIGSVVLFIVTAAVVCAPLLTAYDPAEQDLVNRLAAPSGDHWLGTDHLGRDIFTRILYGGRVSFTVAFIATAISIVIGSTVGGIAGYFGGKVDALLMRMVDVLISFPLIILLILLVSLLQPSLSVIIIVLGAVGWTGVARLVRGEFLSLKKQEFVLASKIAGMSHMRIIFEQILPNALAPVIVAATLGIGHFIMAESTLSFIGLGIQQPIPTWGNMLNDAQSVTIFRKAWWFPTFPGVMILITVLSFNFVGDGLRDALDPQTTEK